MAETGKDPIGLSVYSMVLLRQGSRFLMLQRAGDRTFAPGRWTGIGGRIEVSELDDLISAALREVREETGIEAREIDQFTLRRSLIQRRPGHPLTVLVYFTGELNDGARSEPLTTREGTFHWLTTEQIRNTDVIENTAVVIPALIRDMENDPTGTSPVKNGAASFTLDGVLEHIVWS